MEELIELYLYKHGQCPLHDLGSLELVQEPAIASLAERKIHAPFVVPKFSETILPGDDFTRFVAMKKKISEQDAKRQIEDYCNRLRNMDAYGETRLLHTGKFHVNADGNLVFKPLDITTHYLPSVTAERVIHPDASHSMTVGDRETTSAAMTAYYTETGSSTRDRWWIWAFVIFVLSAAACVFYFMQPGHNSNMGNSQKIQPKASVKTYQQPE